MVEDQPRIPGLAAEDRRRRHPGRTSAVPAAQRRDSVVAAEVVVCQPSVRAHEHEQPSDDKEKNVNLSKMREAKRLDSYHYLHISDVLSSFLVL